MAAHAHQQHATAFTAFRAPLTCFNASQIPRHESPRHHQTHTPDTPLVSREKSEMGAYPRPNAPRASPGPCRMRQTTHKWTRLITVTARFLNAGGLLTPSERSLRGHRLQMRQYAVQGSAAHARSTRARSPDIANGDVVLSPTGKARRSRRQPDGRSGNARQSVVRIRSVQMHGADQASSRSGESMTAPHGKYT
jgi:hypothetical protein